MAEGGTRSAHAARLGAPLHLPSGSVVQSRVRPHPARGARHRRGGYARAMAAAAHHRCRWLPVRTPLPLAYAMRRLAGLGRGSQGVHWMCAGTRGEPAR